MSKFVLNEPRGQYLFEIYTSLSYVRVASYTSHTLPCLNIKHLAVKVTSKDQQTLKLLMLSVMQVKLFYNTLCLQILKVICLLLMTCVYLQPVYTNSCNCYII